MNNARTPATVGHVITRMRRLIGHLGKHDRETVVEAVEAILELSTRLHEATHAATKPSSTLVLTRPDESAAAEGHPI